MALKKFLTTLLFLTLTIQSVQSVHSQTHDRCFNLIIKNEDTKRNEARACYTTKLKLMTLEYNDRPTKTKALELAVAYANYGDTWVTDDNWVAFIAYSRGYELFQHPLIEDKLINMIQYLTSYPNEIWDMNIFLEKRKLVSGKNPVATNPKIKKLESQKGNTGAVRYFDEIEDVEVWTQRDKAEVYGQIIRSE
jgi:hypothetical protein